MERLPVTEGSHVPSAIRERSIAANGLQFHALEAGPDKAPLVLLLHGFPEFSWSWRHQLPALADHFHVIAPDLRGYHLTERPSDGYDLATLTADVRALIAALGYEQADLIGHDWGGVVAWASAIRDPDVVRRLVIVNAPHPASLVEELGNVRQLRRSAYVGFFQLRGLAEASIARDDYALLRRTFRAADRGRAWLTDDDIQQYIEAIARPGALSAALEYYRQLPKALAQLSPMRVILAPTLVLWGELDPYLGPELVDHLDRWVRHLTVRRYPTSGHWLNQQEPERINQEIRSFLDQPAGAD
jgi:pimeloyl-ACP methyl ester carboxylesterase